MKIGILTHPLTSNYGGILQCYALNKYLQKLGHDTIVIDRRFNQDLFLWRWIRSILKFLHFPRYFESSNIDKTIKIRDFVNTKFKRTYPIDSPAKMKNVCKDYCLDAVIVGSDQVWRADYAMQFGYNYFLDFVPDNVIKASYAASFGLSSWDYSLEQTIKIRKLLTCFKGISVREAEAVVLCQDNLQVAAIQHIDPTLLLSSEDYDIIASNRLRSEKYVYVYWLGDKSGIAEEVANCRKEGYVVVENYLRDPNEQMSVEDWLSYIKYADLILTDSFHGCVFSIIYKRPFVPYGNTSGGNGRIVSLCNMLRLAPHNGKYFFDRESVLESLKHEADGYLSRIIQL